MAEAKKVQDFLDGIQVFNTFVRAAVANININGKMKENFTDASDYTDTTVQNDKNSLTRRKISKLEIKKRQDKKEEAQAGSQELF